MNEADYAALNEYLHEVRPMIDDFCSRYGFSYVDKRSLGRYPRIRIEKPGAVQRWIELWMQLDGDRRHFEAFRSDLPYELSAGAHMVVAEESAPGIRFQKSIVCFSDLPFEQVGVVLKDEMEKAFHLIAEWDEQYLRLHGEKVLLRG